MLERKMKRCQVCGGALQFAPVPWQLGITVPLCPECLEREREAKHANGQSTAPLKKHRLWKLG